MVHRLIVGRPGNHHFNTSSIPVSWGQDYTIISLVDFKKLSLDECEKYEIYSIGEDATHVVNIKCNDPMRGSSLRLFGLCNNKFSLSILTLL